MGGGLPHPWGLVYHVLFFILTLLCEVSYQSWPAWPPNGGETGDRGRGPLVGPIGDPHQWETLTLPCPTDMVPVIGQDVGDIPDYALHS